MNTEINKATVLQRINMLTSAPASPVKGRGNVRQLLTNDDEIISAVEFKGCPHLAIVCNREPVNGFGKIGFVRRLYCSPEFAALFS